MALPGNRHAEKWTEAATIAKLQEMEAYLKANKDIVFLGTLLTDLELYSDIWKYWQEKFEGNKNVFRLQKKIDEIIEARIVSGAIRKDNSTPMSIFVLGNKYGWNNDFVKNEDTKPVNFTIEVKGSKEQVE